MRKHKLPYFTTSGVSLNSPIICGAKAIYHIETTPIKIALYFEVIQTDCSARSGFLAPKFCPTKDAAALLIPHAGINVNNITRIAMV